jgi:hypothetical protein
MQEVDSKRVLPKPKEVFVRKEVLGRRGEMDTEGDQLETNARVETGGLGFARENPYRTLTHDFGPTHPFGLVFGVRCKNKAEKDKSWREKT